MKVSLIQTNARADKVANVRRAFELIEQACTEDRPDLVMLPECFTIYGSTVEAQLAAAEPCPGGETYEALGKLAAKHGVFIHAGSMNERDGERMYNTTLVFDRSGKEVARYRKIHMFSITAPDGVVYDEGKIYTPGTDIVTYDIDGVTVGCTICYDLRFPELFQALVARGAKIIAVPAAFTLQTGKEHWEALLRARAIETQCFILAPGQEGPYEEDGATLFNYGHSLVVEPWGAVIARRALGEGIITTRLDLADIDAARSRVQLAAHRAARNVQGL
ncbi:carbon-nitrogen hydrolase family protein [Rhizobium pusense]|uniref:carbon-nitrogen hydrolase family protein n=1 Tax=Agrobacterium pusense TaxID=648995 RepID=UPI001FCD99D5|nr:carbon-nitrogen hydrolase family protein [Agrobacterium pusense]MCJ2877579.1 carbon-nitrogen hydrolase family protein [Agrobacterium pusense]